MNKEEQQAAFARALHRAEACHPAADNYEESRCYTVTHNNLRQAYGKAGLKR